MTTIATLAVRLIADTAEYSAAMNKAGNTAQATAAQISKSLKDTGSAITSVGKNMTTWVTLPILGAGVAALTYASNLEETKNKVDVVFGKMTSDVMSWAKASDTAMGMSQQKALDAVSTFGAMGQAAGLSAKDNLKWSESLVQLGSDWSSFYNLNPVDALNAIQSAVAGQYEPLRRMGVIINQATLEQKAMQMGLMKEGETLSDAARYQALYALMVEKSSAAQGDFARTADGVANQTRIVRAQFENAAATLGQQLLPYATQLLKWASQAIAWFTALTPAQQKWIVVILAIAAAVGPLLILVGSLVTAIGALIPIVTAVGSALLTLAPYLLVIGVALGLLYLAWTNNWGGIQEKTAAVINYVKGLIASGMQFIQDLTSGKLGWLSTRWKATWDTIQMAVHTVMSNIMLLQLAFKAAFHGDWRLFGQYLGLIWKQTWRLIETILSQAWANLVQIIAHLAKNISEYFHNVDWGQVGWNIVKGIAKGLLGALPFLIQTTIKVASAALEAIKGFLSIRSPSMKMEMQVGWPMAAGLVQGLQNGMESLMPGTMQSLMPASVGSVSGMSSGITSGVSAPVSVLVDYRPMISTADEHEARFILAPMIQDEIRKNQKR